MWSDCCLDILLFGCVTKERCNLFYRIIGYFVGLSRNFLGPSGSRTIWSKYIDMYPHIEYKFLLSKYNLTTDSIWKYGLTEAIDIERHLNENKLHLKNSGAIKFAKTVCEFLLQREWYSASNSGKTSLGNEKGSLKFWVKHSLSWNRVFPNHIYK